MAQRRTLRKTKLIATIGPACDSLSTIKAMIQAGMNVARLNFSHGSRADQQRRLETIRQAGRELGANVAVLIDTRGSEIRTGRLRGGAATLNNGETFRLLSGGGIGDERGVPVSYPNLADHVKPGTVILLDDGSIQLTVNLVARDEVVCNIERGGTLRDQKSVNLPEIHIPHELMSGENRDDLRFAIENDIVYIAASFIRSAAEVGMIREVLEDHAANTTLIAKIENREGVRNLDEIVAASDGTMVARGDLGVEIPVQEVPMIQKRIIRTTVTSGKPVITATQMLESMVRNPIPTRAEVSDVANAIFDGTSAIMLSSETAIGEHPVEAVKTMAALALQAESGLSEYGHLQKIDSEPANARVEAVSHAAIAMANHLDATAILTLTETGFTSRSVSKFRPTCPILAVTRSPDVVRKLSMNWGVMPLLYQGPGGSNSEMIRFGLERSRELGLVQSGDTVVATMGLDDQAGSTNAIQVVTVGS
ncbi:pyruvate kinase [Myxococcota bacterium]|nr:pyruvate kinase [Myxococcota bacterium]